MVVDLKQLKEIALANVTDPTSEYFYRYVCRWFSKTFHTPLIQVYDIPQEQVFLAYFEEGYEKLSESEDGEEAMLTDAIKAVDPDYDEKEEESIQEFISLIEEEEENKRTRKTKGKQSLHGTNQAPQDKPVVKTYEAAPEEEADGDGLDGLDSLTESSSVDGSGRTRE